MIALTITRAGLSLTDLVITSDPTGDFVLPEEGIGEPAFDWRYTRAPASADMHGPGALLAAVKDGGTLPLAITVHGDTTAALEANKKTLRDAFEQWSYTIQLLVDGEGGSWECDPTSPRWQDYDSGMTRARMARGSVVVPVYPTA